MQDQNIQHPDITAAERTGYPSKWPKIEIEITPAAQRAFAEECKSLFFDFCESESNVMQEFIEKYRPEFAEWVNEVLWDG